MPQWRLAHGESYLVTGEPVIVSDLAGSIARSIELLLVAVLAVMALTLGLVFSGVRGCCRSGSRCSPRRSHSEACR